MLRLCVLFGGVVGFSSVAIAQSITAKTSVATVRDAPPVNASLVNASTVTVDMHAKPLVDVLRAIAQQAGLTPIYNSKIKEHQDLVSLQVHNIPAAAAFEKVLYGTGWTASIISDKVLFERVQGGRQLQGVIQGKVIHKKTKKPVVGAKVFLDDARIDVVTGDDGTFRITAAPGQYTLQVRAVGFTRHSQKVTLSEGATASIEVALDPSASVLDEVVVTGTVVATERRAIATPITVITGEELEQRGITRLDQILRGEVPGVIAIEEGAARYESTLGSMETVSMYARGASGLNSNVTTPLKIYVDGVELVDPSHIGGLDPRSVDRVEIIVGPQAATIYGAGAMGGVMQIFTKTGADRAPEVALSLQYGMQQSNLNSSTSPVHRDQINVTGGTGPEFSYSANLSHNYSGQWQPGLFSRRYGLSIGATHVRGPLTVTGSVSTTAGTNGTGRFQARLVDRVREGEWLAPGDQMAIASTYSEMKSRMQTVSLNADYRLRSWWQHHITLGESRTAFKMVPMAPSHQSPVDSNFTQRQSGGTRTSYGYNTTLTGAFAHTQHTLVVGVTGSWSDNFTLNGRTVSSTTTSWIQPQINTAANDKSVGGFATWRMGVFDRLFVNFGVRGEQNPNYGRAHKIDWTPTNGITYSLEWQEVTLKLQASYGRATRTPSPELRLDGYYTDPSTFPSTTLRRKGNPDLRPEVSRGPQGGFELYVGNVASLTVNRYRQIIDDLIMSFRVDSTLVTVLWDGGLRWNGISQNQNVAKVRQHGWEGTGKITLGSFMLGGTWSWNDSRILALNDNAIFGVIYPGMMLNAGVPSHSGNIMASYAVGGTSASLSVNFIGASAPVSSFQSPIFDDIRRSRLTMYLSGIRNNALLWSRPKPGYSKANLSLAQQLAPWASLTVNMVNLGNSFAADGSWLNPTLGRTTTIGVRLRR